ncbi:MAG: YfhO family protein, partial [Oscillospiraceae bacterium]
ESYAGDIPKTREVVDKIKEMDTDFYRMEKNYHRTVNDPLSTGLYGVSHSTSTYNKKVIALMKKLGYGAREHYSRYDGATLLTDDIFGIKYVLSKNDRTVPYDNPILTEYGISVFENEDVFPIAYLADLDIVGSHPDSSSPFVAQETLARAISGGMEKLYYPIFDFTFDCQNINIGMTTDDHSSYKKRVESEDAFISYEVIMPHKGAAYMYLPTDYERECALYINDEYLKNYFENENHSIVYLGDYDEGENFTIRLNLYKDAMYVKEPQFFYLDREELRAFNETIAAKNTETTLVKTSPTSLELSVNAAEDCALFTSIPIEEGWTVEIDGEKAAILPAVDDTFMCVRVPAGSHKITLKFLPAGLTAGLIIGAAGVIVLVLLIIGMRILENSSTAKSGTPEMEENYDNGEL